MAKIIFYEKPGCSGNERQKALLARAGHQLEVRDLLSHTWTEAELGAFLGDLPVEDWFDRTAPRVKAGEVRPAGLPRGEAMRLLLAEPALIRRPLLQVGERREVGFLAAVVDAWIGLEPAIPSGCSLDGCSSAGGALCATGCEEPPVAIGRAGARTC